MKVLVYTAVFGGYDRVYPPLNPEPDLDYVIVTDDPSMAVAGWKTYLVDPSIFATPKVANLYYRALIHRVLPGYVASIYVDGNIRLLGKTSRFLEPFLESKSALGVFSHPLRTTVAAEIEACLKLGKVANPELLVAELAEYRAGGFPDNEGLIETGILLKNHNAPDLDLAMGMWWKLFSRHQTRDQISLPFVKWKTGVTCYYNEHIFRRQNPYFAIYPHCDTRKKAILANLSGRSHDSLVHLIVLRIWNALRAVRSYIRSWLK